MQIEVEIDIFSGRPNPRWKLSPSESEQLVKDLSQHALPLSDQQTPSGKLGYRGFVVYRADRNDKLHPWLRVGLGVIQSLAGLDRRPYSDMFGVEDHLINLAGQAGFGAYLENIGRG